MNPKLLSRTEAAKYLNMSRGNLGRLHTTEFAPIFVKQGGRYFYSIDALDNWLKQNPIVNKHRQYKQYEYKTDRGRIIKERNEKIYELYQTGMKLKDISEQCKVHTSYACNLIKKINKENKTNGGN